MRDVTILALADRLWEGQPEEVQEAVADAVSLMAISMMHMFEAKSVNVALGQHEGLPTIFKVTFKDCKDPDFMTAGDAMTAITLAMIGAHSRATDGVTDERKVLHTPLSDLFPYDKDLFEGPKDEKGGEQ